MYQSYFMIVVFLLSVYVTIVIVLRSSLIRNNVIIQKSKTIPHHHVPKFMLELYERNRVSRKKQIEADLVKSVIPSKCENEILDKHVLIFDLPSSGQDEQLISAEFRILTKVDCNDDIGVKKGLSLSIYNDKTHSFMEIQKSKIHHLNDTWLCFNLTREVKYILLDSNIRLLKILIIITHNRKSQLQLSILPVSMNDHHDYPVLILSYILINGTEVENTTRTRRRKRNIQDDENGRKYKRNSCKRRPLYIDFSEINFNLWIVQPTGYDAYQCQGRCFYPFAENLKPSKHAILQSLINSVNPMKASRSCCVPTLLNSISILVEECGCR